MPVIKPKAPWEIRPRRLYKPPYVKRPTKVYDRPKPVPGARFEQFMKKDVRGRVVTEKVILSHSSLRGKDGKILFRSNAHFMRRQNNTFRDQEFVNCPGIDGVPLSDGTTVHDVTEAHNRAYGSFFAKIKDKESDASLGVTFAQADQAKAMMITRYQQATEVMKGVKSRRKARRFVRDMQREFRPGFAGGKLLVKAANTHLEWIFGWKPLISDFCQVFKVLAADPPLGFITGRGKSYKETITVSPKIADCITTTVQEVVIKRSIGAIVEISNPNLWLLNKLGLLNPAPALWDLVPWSFVVNMFLNVNTMLKSIAATVGLRVKDVSVTTTHIGHVRISKRFYYFYGQNKYPTPATANGTYKTRYRSIGGPIPYPMVELRCPELNVDTLLMASALAIQQATRILKLLR